MLVVLDSNVLVSGSLRVLRPAGAPGQLLNMWAGNVFRLAISDHILVELTRTLSKPYFQERLSEAQVRRYIGLLRRQSIRTRITVEVHGVATHPEDDLVLATAVSAGAQYLATGDQKLQMLGVYQGVLLVSPRGLVEILESL